MEIDIDKLTEAELTDLNNRIVARLRFLSQMRAHAQMLEFKIGDRVSLQPEGDRGVVGMLTRYNRKTVTVITDDGQRWNVSPTVLRRVDDARGFKDTWLRYAGSDQGAAAEDNLGSRSATLSRRRRSFQRRECTGSWRYHRSLRMASYPSGCMPHHCARFSSSSASNQLGERRWPSASRASTASLKQPV